LKKRCQKLEVILAITYEDIKILNLLDRLHVYSLSIQSKTHGSPSVPIENEGGVHKDVKNQ